ncbi:MAG: MFS transporter, partial [bacterium]
MERTSLIQFLNNAALFASQIFIPLIAKEFGASPFEVGLVVGVYNLTYFSSNYLFSILADRLRINRLIQFGLLFAAICYCSQLWAHDLFTLIGARMLVGLAAGIFPAALAVYAYNERAGKMGKYSAFTSLGWAFGAILAGLVGSYELIFALSAFMVLISFFTAGSLPDIRSGQPGKLFPI